METTRASCRCIRHDVFSYALKCPRLTLSMAAPLHLTDIWAILVMFFLLLFSTSLAEHSQHRGWASWRATASKAMRACGRAAATTTHAAGESSSRRRCCRRRERRGVRTCTLQVRPRRPEAEGHDAAREELVDGEQLVAARDPIRANTRCQTLSRKHCWNWWRPPSLLS